MAILLLNQYEAHATPFQFKKPLTGEKMIGGIKPYLPWDQDLYDELLKAWTEAQATQVIKEWKLPSKKTQGVFYTIKKMQNGWVCSCPAHVECWHIKVAKELCMTEDQDDLSGRPQTEAERYG